MIVASHVAAGALAGAALGSRRAALLAGPLLHLLGDLVPHRDFDSRLFEFGTGALGIAALAATRGPLEPATLGALAASAPDAEHLLPAPGGRRLFPSHRYAALHKRGGIGPWPQLVGSVLALAALLPRRA